MFIIWQNIANCKQADNLITTPSLPNKKCNSQTDSTNEESNLVIHADCHSANRGLFGGIVVLVICIVSIILYFITISDE